ncbi:glycosyl transferase family 2 [Kineothrix alysoides]|uniref:Glycosyl transferase family 2 n=1 Tax=Kineothrix alysoides TaxID=1469948 RepID=A0A4R1R213_9FIRM|nr:glycosyltransferase [Kineothrix alysoides]TCL59400.1 glycosyl transferase family 2 [Kineothrix alysoides]
MEKKVSIIVPVYNAEKYVERCLDSLLVQTYANTEIIIIDDGSVDGSAHMCNNYASQHNRIKVVHIANGGVSAARNRGIEEAEGEYLTFVDADDYLKYDMIEYLAFCLEETGSDVAGCNFFSLSAAKEVGRVSVKGTEEEPVQRSEDNKEMWKTYGKLELLCGEAFIERGILNGDTRCWSKVYRREAVGDIRYEEGISIGEDMLFLLALARKGSKFCRSPYKGYAYFSNETGAMNRRFKNSYMDQIICWKIAMEQIGESAPHLRAKVASILMISTMLVAGKLAALEGSERKKCREAVSVCRRQLEECRKVKGACKKLSFGYRVKVTTYAICPGLYLWGYHLLKA